MTLKQATLEQSLLAPCMEAVIAVTERYQFLEDHQGARVFTAYREIDHVIKLGFSEDLQGQTFDLENRGFQILEAREGTRREHRLLMLTLKEIGYAPHYNNEYFQASKGLLRHLRNLGWPLGELAQLLKSQRTH